MAIALLTCLWLLVLKLSPAGSAALALSIGGCGLVFGGVAAIGAQLAVTARGARGIAIAALGAAFVLRAVGVDRVALVGVIGVFGLPLQWPTWMMDISPFTQIPKLPAEPCRRHRCSGSAPSR